MEEYNPGEEKITNLSVIEYRKGLREGDYIEFNYESHNIKSLVKYCKSQRNGFSYFYSPSGNLRYIEVYNKGRFLNGYNRKTRKFYTSLQELELTNFSDEE